MVRMILEDKPKITNRLNIPEEGPSTSSYHQASGGSNSKISSQELGYKVMVGNPATDYLSSFKQTSYTFQDKTSKLFNNEEKSDIMFLVGKNQERFYGHSLIISLASKVFENMFETEWKDKKTVILNFNASAFFTIMRFIYRQEIVFQEQHLKETLKLAHRYNMWKILKKLTIPQILEKHAWKFWLFAYECGFSIDKDCYMQTMMYIDKNANSLVAQNDFLDLPLEIVAPLVKRGCFIVDELVFFNATLNWAKKRCQDEGSQPSPARLRTKMASFIHEFRFPLMDGRDFKDGPAKTGILSGDECFRILCAIVYGDKKGCGFKYDPRLPYNVWHPERSKGPVDEVKPFRGRDRYVNSSRNVSRGTSRNRQRSSSRNSFIRNRPNSDNNSEKGDSSSAQSVNEARQLLQTALSFLEKESNNRK